jgi:transcription elongation GreA/GreB family factor
MNKRLVLKKIIRALEEHLEVLARAAHASHLEATHESSKAESKYDTRGLEASYLAGGQARQARDILEAIKEYQALPVRELGPEDAIDIGALVKLQANTTSNLFFLGPKSGGLEIEHEGEEITVVTPQSPVGQNVMGKKAGEKWEAKVGGSVMKYRVVKVW